MSSSGADDSVCLERSIPRKGVPVAQKLSPVNMVIRVVLILILLVMIGAFVFERRAAGQAKTAYDHARNAAKEKQPPEVAEKEIGRKPDEDESKGTLREQRWIYKGLIRDYTVRLVLSTQATGTFSEEANLDVFNKLKREAETSPAD